MKKLLIVFMLLMILLISCINATAATNHSDEVFDIAFVSLSATKTASFTAVTYGNQNSIMVTQVRLYKLNASNNWELVGYLPAPTNIAVNTDVYGSSMNYSSYIGTGTYKIRATFTADGHSTSRYSNTLTY